MLSLKGTRSPLIYSVFKPFSLNITFLYLQNLVETYEYSNTQGYKLSFNRLEEGGFYYCQVKDKPDQRIDFEVTIIEHCEFSTTELLLRPTTTTAATTTITTSIITIGTSSSPSSRIFRARDHLLAKRSNVHNIGGDGVTASISSSPSSSTTSTSTSSYHNEPLSSDKTGSWPTLGQVGAVHSELLFAERRQSMSSDANDSSVLEKFKRSILDQFVNGTPNTTLEDGTFEDLIQTGNTTESNGTSFDDDVTFDYLDEDAGNGTVVGTSFGYDNATEDRSTTTATTTTTTPRYSHEPSYGENSTHVTLPSTSKRNYISLSLLFCLCRVDMQTLHNIYDCLLCISFLFSHVLS